MICSRNRQRERPSTQGTPNWDSLAQFFSVSSLCHVLWILLELHSREDINAIVYASSSPLALASDQVRPGTWDQTTKSAWKEGEHSELINARRSRTTTVESREKRSCSCCCCFSLVDRVDWYEKTGSTTSCCLEFLWYFASRGYSCVLCSLSWRICFSYTLCTALKALLFINTFDFLPLMAFPLCTRWLYSLPLIKFFTLLCLLTELNHS